jgi:rhamnosyltransferase
MDTSSHPDAAAAQDQPARVGVLLATFNGSKFLQQQLISITSQAGVSIEICLRDDGSSDETLDIARRTVPAQALRIVDPGGNPCGIPSGNFFRLLTLVDPDPYEYICLSDQDDIWSPDKLACAIQLLKDEKADCYSSDLVAYDTNRQRAWYIRKSQPQKALDYLFQGASAGCTYVLTAKAAKLVRERLLHSWDRIPNLASHDWLIYAICRSHGLRWAMDADARIFYRQHSANAFGAMPAAKGLLARMRLARSGWYRQHIRELRPFLRLSECEAAVLQALDRMGWRDRLALARQVGDFRRTSRDARLLAAAILFGAF